MNILVIFTGGTISSSLNDGYIGPNEANNFKLIDSYKKCNPDKCSGINFSTAMPYYILSENMTGRYINLLADCIDKALASNTLNGIIITHGTDTLQYTSAALSYIYPDVKIPIVLVSSNYILGDSRANGTENFAAAVDFILKCNRYDFPIEGIQNSNDTHVPYNTNDIRHSGVYVSYKNKNESAVIHYGARLLAHMSYSDEIYSVDNIVAYHNKDRKNDNYSQTACNNISEKNHRVICDKKPRFTENSPVMFIRPYPGQKHDFVPEHVKAILLDTYHSGTLCTESAELRDMFLNAKSRNIPVFLTGAESQAGYERTKRLYRCSSNLSSVPQGTCLIGNEVSYESTKAFKELSINVLPKASPIAMYMKLWLLTSVECEDILSCMMTPFCYDFL